MMKDDVLPLRENQLALLYHDGEEANVRSKVDRRSNAADSHIAPENNIACGCVRGQSLSRLTFLSLLGWED